MYLQFLFAYNGPTNQNNQLWLGGSKLHSKLWFFICIISCFVVGCSDVLDCQDPEETYNIVWAQPIIVWAKVLDAEVHPKYFATKDAFRLGLSPDTIQRALVGLEDNITVYIIEYWHFLNFSFHKILLKCFVFCFVSINS